MLNTFAFSTRIQAIRRIGETMTVRNSRFVSSRIQVSKARISSPVPRQKAIAGSVAKARFTGWAEQEFGTPQKRNRFATMAARNNNPQKQMRHIVRLKPRNEVVTREDYQMTSKHTASQFLAAAIRKKENRMIRVKGVIMKRRRNKFEPVQILKRPKQPKRNKWLLTSRNDYFKATNLDALWRKHYGATLRPPPKR